MIDEEAAAVVREVFTLFSQGYGKTAIARLLNDRGIPNPTEYKRRHGLRYRQPTKKNSTLWKYSAIADMLENEYELYYFSESVKDGILSFDYKLKRGVATEHNAIKILEICDYPASLVSEAHSITSI